MKTAFKPFFVGLLCAVVFLATLPATIAGTDPLQPYTGGIFQVAGTPSNGTSCVQTITLGGTPTAGTFTLTYKGETSAAITWSATSNTTRDRIDAALEAMGTLAGGSSVTTATTATAGIGDYTVTFTGNYAKLNAGALTATSSLTGTSPTITIAQTTPGVTADGRSSSKGSLCVDTTNGKLYINQGTTGLAPTWVAVPSQ